MIVAKKQSLASRAGGRRESWGRALAFAELPGITLATTVGVGHLRWRVSSADDGRLAQAESVQAAIDGTVALLSYGADSVESELDAAGAITTGPFNQSSSLTRDVIPAANKRQISTVATVPATASSSAALNHAVVLVFIDQSVTFGKESPTGSAPSVRVALEKVDGRWLISDCTPV
jgi:Mce-associated membrane protein